MASPPPRPLLLEPATEADIPTLASILVAALFPEPTMAFFFPSWPSTSGMTRFYTARLTAKFHDPDSELLKLTYGDEIVGLGSITLKEGETKEYSKAAPMKGFDPEFAWASGECFRKTEGLMLGRKSYWLTSCATLPSYQGKGFGSKLVQYCVQKADEAGLPMYCNSFPKARILYARFGFEDKVVFDQDLNEFGMKYRGYDVHRSYGMVREPVKKGLQ